MFLFGFIIFTLVIFVPISLCLWRASSIKNATQDPAADLYREQLDTLKKEHSANLMNDLDYDASRYNIERKLSNSTISPPREELNTSRIQIIIAISSLLIIPIVALFLYSINGLPFLSSQSADERSPINTLEISAQTQLNQLDSKLNTLSKKDPAYASLHIRRGDLELQMGTVSQTVRDWKIALDTSFTPELALKIAELETRNAGHVTKDALSLYRKALDASPEDAPWRLNVEERIASGEHDKDTKKP